jgi:Amt family ammonium transporter
MVGLMVGNPLGFDKHRFDAHNTLLTFMGTAMLFIGWQGFNAGSANAANGAAAIASLNSIVAPAVSALSWMIIDSFDASRPRFIGMVNGMIAGLIAITPCAFLVDTNGAFWVGFISGPLCNYGARMKSYLGFDDALDAFGLHAIGGMVGGILCGFFAKTPLAPNNGVFYGGLHEGGHQLAMQLYGIVVVGGWSLFATTIILLCLDMTVGLRIPDEDDPRVLESKRHGEYSSGPPVVQKTTVTTQVVVDFSVNAPVTRSGSSLTGDANEADEDSTCVVGVGGELEDRSLHAERSV